MPGILPMKVIKVGGNNAQSRIAQACDRCRSKKIRCDGIRPSCTQCINVGFECKTSDKLSRRAFPRGYTESLEERVRALELEVRELKDLLDEKDEKIDILSRIHPSHSPRSNTSNTSPARKPSTQSPAPIAEKRQEPQEKDETFRVSQSPLLLEDENRDSYFVGLSSGRTLVDSFKRRVQESGRPCADIVPESFFHPGAIPGARRRPSNPRLVSWKAPPRLASDQMINVFFQEWAPIFPVLHRPTFLSLYERFVSNPESMSDRKSLALLNLVFGIAALSSISHDAHDIGSYEAQWQNALESVLMENSLQTMQCLVLAQIYCMLSGDYPKLLKYKGLAITLAHRLGLHQPQKRFALGTLTVETRKKVFWTQYTLDCMSAAHLGLPKLFRESEVNCEYPSDADDEYVTEGGFLPTLPGEATKISGALAFFRASRILARVLDETYPATPVHDISFRCMARQAEELDSWYNNLPPHLRLTFAQDKPSTNVTGNRSPILSLFYHYTRALIFRPAVCANLGARSYSATLAVGHSSKSLVQIVQLLDERNLSFSIPINRNELLVLAGFGLLIQTAQADIDGKLMRDCQKMTLTVMELLEKGQAPFSTHFRRIGYSMLTSARQDFSLSLPLSCHSSGDLTIHESTFNATQRHLKALASRFPSISRAENKDVRRATLPNLGYLSSNKSSTSLNSNISEPLSRSEPALSPNSIPTPKQQQLRSTSNLDFLSFDNTPIPSSYPPPHQPLKEEVSASDWERLLGSLDNGATNIYDTIYGGPPIEALIGEPTASSNAWSADVWNSAAPILSNYGLDHAGQQSAPSFSDESLTSGEDFGSTSEERGFGSVALMPELSPALGLEGAFGL